MKESLSLRFLYKTVPGRVILKAFVCPKVSVIAGKYLSSGASKWLVPYYVRKHKISLKGIEIPQNGFSSFNAFFTRKKRRKPHTPVSASLISPCEGYLTCLKIKKNLVFNVKHTAFSLEDLLKDKRLAAKFYDGTALIFRLTPANYHRYCYAADGHVLHSRKISGKLHCVRPIALREIPVFAQNSREYQVIRTEQFGTMVQMEIGALLVGKISNHMRAAETYHVFAGSEKGYFEFGGSTIILLFSPNAVRIREQLLKNKNSEGEVSVRMGDVLS
ncbi:phosphatidylserine decarboxylase [Lachnospiraceae bacterium]|nr:phosphatidylserine decarboxylase [Lachnospiraceae bacterium]